MTDVMVRATQHWLNATYRGKHGYQPVAENGITGWATVHALLRALQIELGIAEPSDNFGDATTSKYKAAPIVAPANAGQMNNKYAILQGRCGARGMIPSTTALWTAIMMPPWRRR